jgi:TolA-binding protein
MLKPRRRVTRDQIKEDKFMTFAAKASDYYNRNSRNILAAAGIIVVLIIVGVFYFNSRAQAEKDASFDLTMAKLEMGQGSFDAAIEKLVLLIDNYGGTQSAGDALFFLANARLAQQDWLAARNAFQDYRDHYGKDPMLTAGAITGIGFTLEQEGKFAEAAQNYWNAATKYPKEFNAPQYLLDAGRCYRLAGDDAHAAQAYDLILEHYQDSPQSRIAKDELDR